MIAEGGNFYTINTLKHEFSQSTDFGSPSSLHMTSMNKPLSIGCSACDLYMIIKPTPRLHPEDMLNQGDLIILR